MWCSTYNEFEFQYWTVAETHKKGRSAPRPCVDLIINYYIIINLILLLRTWRTRIERVRLKRRIYLESRGMLFVRNDYNLPPIVVSFPLFSEGREKKGKKIILSYKSSWLWFIIVVAKSGWKSIGSLNLHLVILSPFILPSLKKGKEEKENEWAKPVFKQVFLLIHSIFTIFLSSILSWSKVAWLLSYPLFQVNFEDKVPNFPPYFITIFWS